ncbi:MAG: hypothetical protein WAU75_24320 [Solirubrobacteraceae bacterium]
MRRPGTAQGVATLATVCLLTGCGGGHTATKQDVIARANGICVNTLRAVRNVPPPAGGSLPALATYLGKVQPIIDKEAADTRALPRPAQDRAILNHYVAAVSAGAAQYHAAATAAKSDDSAAVSQALGALRDNTAPTFAARYGLDECSASAGTKAP